MVELFKQISGIYRVEAHHMKLDNNIARGQDKKLKKQRTSKTVRQNILTLRANNTWNSLLREMLRSGAKPKCFKSQIRQIFGQILF